MSFSSDIKNELCKLEFKRECCLRAECYGAWLFSKCFTLKEAAFVTENGAWPGECWNWLPQGPVCLES